MCYKVHGSRSSSICDSFRRTTFLITAFLLSAPLLFTSASNDNICALGVITPGVTHPKGDINIEVGNPLEIFCSVYDDVVDKKDQNSSDLVFYHNENEVPAELVTVVNETTIRLYVEEPPPSVSVYYCYLKTPKKEMQLNRTPYTAVCLNKVFVGTKPQEVKNFTCVSHNWQNLNCTWQKPENYVTTLYSIKFYFPGRAGRRTTYSCPTNTDKLSSYCVWNDTTDPIYRMPYEYYIFVITGENVLGTRNFQYRFHHYAHMIPAMPDKLTVVNLTSHSALLNWSIPFPLSNFPPGINHKLEYQSEYDPADKWHTVNITNLTKYNESFLFNLTGLPFAYTMYDVRVFLKSVMADNNSWSAPASSSFRTAAILPPTPPKTDIGSFEVITGISRDIYIYWQHLKEELKNGNNFEYKIVSVEENGIEKHLTPSEIGKSYARFKSVTHNSYRFTIASYNSVGFSKDRSVIYVPSTAEAPKEPQSFTKISFGGGTFELSWKPPVNNKHIEDYTLFWCKNEYDSPYQCTGLLNWIHVPRNTTIHNITVYEEAAYQFAVSANTATVSSGMVWAACTVVHNRGVGRMRNVWINHIGSKSIEVGWKLDCSERIGTVKGYAVRYCPIISPTNLTCKTSPNKIVVKDVHKMKIEGLEPYTTYLVTVAVITNAGEGSESDPLYNTTLEGPPDPVMKLNVTDITNTSMTVSWIPPVKNNGVLRYYLVHYSNVTRKVESTQTEVRLSNLTAFHLYNISVSACTSDCSKITNYLEVATAIGPPGIVDAPIVKFLNTSLANVKWKRPSNPAGPINYYEIMVQQSDSKRNLSYNIYNSTNTSLDLHLADCANDGLKYFFLIRAVNVRKNETYFGPWSESADGNCISPGITTETKTFLFIIGGLLVVTILAVCLYFCRYIYYWCLKMKDIKVKLPPGLVPISEKEKDHSLKGIHWPVVDSTDQNPSSKSNINSADEELLLKKKEPRDGNDNNGDSSGCSTGGHDSVSSSLTSDSRMSSDSGTGVEQRPISPNIFDEMPALAKSSLRQRLGNRGLSVSDLPLWEPHDTITKGSTEPIISAIASSMPGIITSSTGYALPASYLNMSRSDKDSHNFDSQSLKDFGYSCIDQDILPDKQLEAANAGGNSHDYVSVSKMMGMQTPSASSQAINPARSPDKNSGYISNNVPWTPSKGSLPTGGYVMATDPSTSVSPSQSLPCRGYVMTGEAKGMGLAVNNPTESLLKDVNYLEYDDDDYESKDCLDKGNNLGSTTSRIPHSFDLELRTFGANETDRQASNQEQMLPKSSKGYVVLADTQRSDVPKQQESCKYVPHRQFDQSTADVEKPYVTIPPGTPSNNG